MSEDQGGVIVRQGGRWLSSAIAGRIRDRGNLKPELLPEPDRPARKSAEALIAGQAPDPGGTIGELAYGPLEIPDSIFAGVEDREQAKLILTQALKAKGEVHVLLEGDPASGKSELLKCIARLPRARYAVGGMTTSAGMTEYLLERRSTQILVVDELQEAQNEDFAAFYSLMTEGMVPLMKHGRTEVIHWRGRIFAGCTRTDRFPPALLSRFVRVKLEPYSAAEVQQVGEAVLRREGLSPARAKAIAERVARQSRDPRDIVQVGRLAGEEGDFEPFAAHVVKSTETG